MHKSEISDSRVNNLQHKTYCSLCFYIHISFISEFPVSYVVLFMLASELFVLEVTENQNTIKEWNV